VTPSHLLTDPDRATQSYRPLCGWTIDTTNAVGCREVETGGTPGGIWPAPPGATSFIQLFIGVPDVEAATQQATDLGTSVIVPPTSLPDGAVLAVLRDPCGVSFGLMRQRLSEA
jgi:predicted enzyme related to lactoylglutathione lyase